MGIGGRQFEPRFLALAIFVTTTVVAIAVAVFAYQQNLDSGDTAFSIGSTGMVSPSPSWPRADHSAVNQLASFLKHWTTTAGPGGE
jgi:hypothetical protein